MAHGVITEGDVVAVGDDGFVSLGDGKRDEIVGLTGERGGDGHGDGGDHAFEIVFGDGDLSGTRVADAVGRL